MKKIILCLLIMLLASFNVALANTKTPAKDITVDASGFNKNLNPNDNTVQKALQKVNDLDIGSGGGSPGGSQGQFQYNNAGNFLGGSMLYTDGTNVGVKNSSPTQALDVTGNILASGTINASNFSGSSSGTNTGDQNLSTLMVKSNNLSDVVSVSSSRINLGLGDVATKNIDNNSAHYLDGTGNWTTPSGGGGSGTVSTGTVGGVAVYTGTTTVGSSSVITQTGSNIGVNTLSPAYNMEVVGSFGATSINTSGTGQAQMSSANGIAFDGNSAIMGTPDLVIATTTNVGIGTSTPTEKLHVVGNVLATTFSGSGASLTAIPDGGLTLTDVTTNNASTSKHGFLPKLNNDSTYFLDGTGAWAVPAGGGGASGWTDGGTNVYVTTTTDRVGIGTTTPNSTTTLEIVKQSSNNLLMISSSASGAGNYFIVNSAGAVGIGTALPSSSEQFRVANDSGNTQVKINSGTGSNYAQIGFGDANSNRWAIGNDTSDNFVIGSGSIITSGQNIIIKRADGNIGIGTATATGRLVVYASGTSLGWSIQSGTNTACTTTCGARAAVHGWDGSTPVGPTDATADTCLCAAP